MNVIARVLLACLIAGCGRVAFDPAHDAADVTVDATPPRITDGLLVLYRFEEGAGALVRDVSGVAPALDLEIAPGSPVSWSPTGLRIEGPDALVATPVAADKILTACVASQALTVEAWITPASMDALSTNGPDRVVTMSDGTDERDFTLGRGPSNSPGALDAYSLRVRTNVSDSNGLPGLDTPPGTVSAQRTHVVATVRRPGDLVLYVDGVERARSPRDETLAWNPHPLAIGNELTRDRVFLGEFHLVAVYARALSAGEVAQNFAARQ